ncbi:MAG TPA: nucleoside 2-deoxyribosyltransferase [bacterium]|nr:nucleoside 2-deoxyribosyltransferase [bacterium]HPN33562.1 nucleoside 2-deoxyribosyltransferase [bacterium]
MQIYFAASIAGGRDFLPTYQRMVGYLKDLGHVVSTEHIVAPNVWHQESRMTPEQIYERDVIWLQQADGVVAEVSNPSLGVGYEICYALFLVKPVLCLYHEPVLLSRMILGNHRPGLRLCAYRQDEEWQKAIELFLPDCSQEPGFEPLEAGRPAIV